MSMDFSSLDDFVRQLKTLQPEVEKAQRSALQKVAAEIKADAKGILGEYQPAVGSFSSWRQLKDSTKAARLKAGYSENDPLEASGALHDSIHYHTTVNKAVIGSALDYAAAQEKGVDKKLPARPYLGPAAYRHSERAAELVGEAVAKALSGQKSMDGFTRSDGDD